MRRGVATRVVASRTVSVGVERVVLNSSSGRARETHPGACPPPPNPPCVSPNFAAVYEWNSSSIILSGKCDFRGAQSVVSLLCLLTVQSFCKVPAPVI